MLGAVSSDLRYTEPVDADNIAMLPGIGWSTNYSNMIMRQPVLGNIDIPVPELSPPIS
jgi:hypothetical protein